MKLMMLTAALAALAGCNRGQTASAQTATPSVLQRDGGSFLTPTITPDAAKLQLTPTIDAGRLQLAPPAGTPPPGTTPPSYPTGGTSGTIPR